MLQVENMKSTRTGESVANQFFITVDSLASTPSITFEK